MNIRTAQDRLWYWAVKCFGIEIVLDKKERAKRVVEEAIELAQASGLEASDIADLTQYVFSRPVGEPTQEIAGVLVTTLALAGTFGIDAETALENEINRISTPAMMKKIREKRVSKIVAGIASMEGLPA